MTLRLEGDAWQSVVAFQHQHRLESPSAAIRVLIDIATRDIVELDMAFRRAAWREGTRKAAKKFRDKMEAAVAECLGVAGSDV